MKRRAIAIALLLVAVLLALGARRLAAGWLASDGVSAAQRPLRAGPRVPTPPRAPLRVVVLDGLSTADATDAAMPALAALCDRGVELAVDVGFPTKSLPVQAVLWTGLTAQQLGLGPTNAARDLPPGALPTRVPGARAVVEAWTVVARSVGFARLEPGLEADAARDDATPAAVAAWATRFPDAARAAVASSSPLVLVHVLAIDEAGHAGGRGAPAYRRAITDADALLARLVAAAPTATWVVTSDHGHRARGGHGDVERDLRVVRACVAPRPPNAPAQGAVHLVDLARHLHDVAGVAPRTGAVGRPLASAMRAPDVDATVPRASRFALALAPLVLVAGVGFAAWWARPRWLAAWLPLALALYLLWRGVPSLSSRDARGAILCALLAAAPALVLARRSRRTLAVIALEAGAALVAAAIAAEVPAALFGGRPPARPYTTAAFELVAGGAVAVALAVLAVALLSAAPDSPPGRRRGAPSGLRTRRRAVRPAASAIRTPRRGVRVRKPDRAVRRSGSC